jgi:hypothetical protein
MNRNMSGQTNRHDMGRNEWVIVCTTIQMTGARLLALYSCL